MDAALIESAVIELHTFRDLVRWGVSQFIVAKLYYGHGTDNPWDEASWLALHCLHLSPADIDRIADANLLASERRAIAKLLFRRIRERKPAAYLTKEAWFAGLSFYVDERVIVPRSPFAELIDKQFEPWIQPEEVGRILDLCTGSACIAIACALAFPDIPVDAVDLSEDAIAVAQINVEKHQVADQVNLITSDLFTKLKGQKYDLIVSNPPYVGEAEWQSLPAEYHQEPHMALVAEDNGIAIASKIIHEAADYLTDHGVLIVEVGNSAPLIAETFPDLPFVWLEFERGGEGVFLLTAEQLRSWKNKA